MQWATSDKYSPKFLWAVCLDETLDMFYFQYDVWLAIFCSVFQFCLPN